MIGLSDRAIDERISNGGWRRLLPGVFALPGVPIGRSAHLLAALRWAGDESALWGPTAGEVLGLHGVDREELIHLAGSGRKRHPTVRYHRLRADDRPRTLIVGGLRVTAVPRTLFDMSSCLPLSQVGLAMDDALRRGLTTLSKLREELTERGERGVRGSKVFRLLLQGRDSNDERVHTVFESRMLRILRRIGDPGLVADHPVIVGTGRYVIDFAYPRYRLGIECHSIKWHLAREWLQKDVERDRRLKRSGWTLLYYTWDDVHFRAGEIESEVRSFLLHPPRAHPSSPV